MKNNRHRIILNLIKQNKIRTHEQLVDELKAEGILVTQATVSRDIKELGIIKIPDEKGSIYAVAKEWDNSLSKFALDVVDVKCASNIVVIHTKPGMASAVAAAVDGEMKAEIVGSIAGDDTIFIVVGDKETADKLTGRMKEYFA